MLGNYMNAGTRNEQTIGFEMAFLTKVRHFQESNRIYIFTCVVYIKMQGQRKLLTSESSLVLM